MKLMTEMKDGCVHAIGYCIDADSITRSEVAKLEHDAAAAHALTLSIDETIHSPKTISIAIILIRADELMREWGFNP